MTEDTPPPVPAAPSPPAGEAELAALALSALDALTPAVALCGPDGRLRRLNGAMAALLGMDAALSGPALATVLAAAPGLTGSARDALRRVCQAGAGGAATLSTPRGAVRTAARHPLPGGWMLVVEAVAAEATPDTDPLTSLPGREALETRLAILAPAPARREVAAALLLLGLDRFRHVNDTMGHGSGDALLRIVVGRLRSALRAGDLLTRVGGDEFAVLLPVEGSEGGTLALADRLLDLVGRPYLLQGQVVGLRASVGLACAPRDGDDAATLLRHAGLALQAAKAAGGGARRSFAPSLDAAAQDRRRLETALRRALVLRQFELRYQPLLDLSTGRLAGFEALLRWRHPEHGQVPPDRFIPLAEETGLIVPIGEWVLRTACAEAAGWPGTLRVAVNVAAHQFEGGRLAGVVEQALAASGLPGERLELELTESALLRHAPATLEALHTMRANGVRIAMDDFGTGFSSLTQLRSFPFDRIKIDRGFVSGGGGRCRGRKRRRSWAPSPPSAARSACA